MKIVLTDLYHLSLIGIDSKSTPFHGTWTEGTSERSSTHPALCNRTSGEMKHTNTVAFVIVSGVIFRYCALSKSSCFVWQAAHWETSTKGRQKSKLGEANSGQTQGEIPSHESFIIVKLKPRCLSGVCAPIICLNYVPITEVWFFFLSHVEYLFIYWNYALMLKKLKF